MDREELRRLLLAMCNAQDVVTDRSVRLGRCEPELKQSYTHEMLAAQAERNRLRDVILGAFDCMRV